MECMRPTRRLSHKIKSVCSGLTLTLTLTLTRTHTQELLHHLDSAFTQNTMTHTAVDIPRSLLVPPGCCKTTPGCSNTPWVLKYPP